MNKYGIYKIIAPFRSNRQSLLMKDRSLYEEFDFISDLGGKGVGGIEGEVWRILRGMAFVPDFRPHPLDSLDKIYGIGGEEIRDEIVEPIINRLNMEIDRNRIGLVNFDDCQTPVDIVNVINFMICK